MTTIVSVRRNGQVVVGAMDVVSLGQYSDEGECPQSTPFI